MVRVIPTATIWRIPIWIFSISRNTATNGPTMDVKLVLICCLVTFWVPCGSYNTPWAPGFSDFDFGRKYNGPPPQEVMVDYINRLGLLLLDVRYLIVIVKLPNNSFLYLLANKICILRGILNVFIYSHQRFAIILINQLKQILFSASEGVC